MENKDFMVENRPKENVLFGIVGAFLFSLAGGVLWYVLYQLGFLAGISGLVGVVCAMKGYSFFAKGESKKGVVISVIIAMIVMIIAWYMCLANDIYVIYQEWYASGEVDYAPTFFEAAANAYTFLTEPEIATAYFKDLGIGLVLCVIGCGSNVISAFKGAGKEKNSEVLPAQDSEPAAPVYYDPTQDTDTYEPAEESAVDTVAEESNVTTEETVV